MSVDLWERVQHIKRTVPTIREDIRHDVEWLEGKPFDGKTLATAHGNLSAVVDALAGAIAVLAEHVERSAKPEAQLRADIAARIEALGMDGAWTPTAATALRHAAAIARGDVDVLAEAADRAARARGDM